MRTTMYLLPGLAHHAPLSDAQAIVIARAAQDTDGGPIRRALASRSLPFPAVGADTLRDHPATLPLWVRMPGRTAGDVAGHLTSLTRRPSVPAHIEVARAVVGRLDQDPDPGWTDTDALRQIMTWLLDRGHAKVAGEVAAAAKAHPHLIDGRAFVAAVDAGPHRQVTKDAGHAIDGALAALCRNTTDPATQVELLRCVVTGTWQRHGTIEAALGDVVAAMDGDITLPVDVVRAGLDRIGQPDGRYRSQDDTAALLWLRAPLDAQPDLLPELAACTLSAYKRPLPAPDDPTMTFDIVAADGSIIPKAERRVPARATMIARGLLGDPADTVRWRWLDASTPSIAVPADVAVMARHHPDELLPVAAAELASRHMTDDPAAAVTAWATRRTWSPGRNLASIRLDRALSAADACTVAAHITDITDDPDRLASLLAAVSKAGADTAAALGAAAAVV